MIDNSNIFSICSVKTSHNERMMGWMLLKYVENVLYKDLALPIFPYLSRVPPKI